MHSSLASSPIAGLRGGLYQLFCLVGHGLRILIFLHIILGVWADNCWIIAAWAGSLMNGPLADRLGRKISMIVAVVIFTVGSAIQAGAVNAPMLFAGKDEIFNFSLEFLAAC